MPLFLSGIDNKIGTLLSHNILQQRDRNFKENIAESIATIHASDSKIFHVNLLKRTHASISFATGKVIK